MHCFSMSTKPNSWIATPFLASVRLGLAAAFVIAPAALLKAEDLEPLKLDLPAPAFKGTPKDMVVDPNVEPLSDKPRAPFMVPAGLKNLARGKKPTSSVPGSNTGIELIVDGDKEAYDTSIYLVKKGSQWVQLDLGETAELFAIVVWHAHDTAKIYRDVVVQVSNDENFADGVQTLFNNDRDNSSGQGAGKDREYFESAEGRLIDAKGVKARYVRCHSKGSTESALNEYTEIEVYGRPAR